MRILQLAPPWFPVPPDRYGGTELIVAALTDGLVAAGHDVTLLASGGSRTTGCLRSVYTTPPSAQIGDAVTELPHVLAGYRDRHEFDLVHDHTAIGAGLASLLDGPPVVHTVHGSWDQRMVRLYREVEETVHLVAISHDQAARAPSGLSLAGTVHNGIDLDRYPFRQKPTGRGHLAWLGRAGPDKGADLAVEVARRLGRPLRLGIKVNEAAEDIWWRELLRPRLDEIDAEVVVNATHAQKVDILRDASVVLFPIRWDEPFGLVMAEANACGTPVVAFARGAAPEVLSDGVTGILVDPGDVDGMCAAVERAEELDRGACRTWVEEHFSADRMVQGYLEVYDAVSRQ